MQDEFFDRIYSADRDAFNNGLEAAITYATRKLRCTFTVLHNIQYFAPWVKRSRDIGCA